MYNYLTSQHPAPCSVLRCMIKYPNSLQKHLACFESLILNFDSLSSFFSLGINISIPSLGRRLMITYIHTTLPAPREAKQSKAINPNPAGKEKLEGGIMTASDQKNGSGYENLKSL